MKFTVGIENEIVLTEAMERGMKARVVFVSELDDTQLREVLAATRGGLLTLELVED